MRTRSKLKSKRATDFEVAVILRYFENLFSFHHSNYIDYKDGELHAINCQNNASALTHVQ